MKDNNECCSNGCPPVPCGGCKKGQTSALSPTILSEKMPDFAGEILAKNLPPVIIHRERIGMPDFAGEILNKGGL